MQIDTRSLANNFLTPSIGTYAINLLFLFLILSLSTSIFAKEPIFIEESVNGLSIKDSIMVWHDPSDQKSLEHVIEVFQAGGFEQFDSPGSTGFIKGAIWSHFTLQNVTTDKVELALEYVDHQLISLEAFSTEQSADLNFTSIANLSLLDSFNEREYPHIRFVFSTTLQPGQTQEFLVKYSSQGNGYVFPALRIWTPSNLQKMQNLESIGLSFLFGGLFLMFVFAFVVGLITRRKLYFVYSIYALAKIVAWATIFGYTHKYVLSTNFHWSYISISGAFTIFCGLVFTRMFLETRKYTPWLDKFLLFMIANAVLLFVAALLHIKALAILSITVALLLYPVAFIAGIRRWSQGSKEALVYAVAWSFLATGLVSQALRDLGYVEHNFVNYYWPPLASYTEMIVIIVAIGIKVLTLRQQKIVAEKQYRDELEKSKIKLEVLVGERTIELQQQKLKAEIEAQTDSLTGTKNRRSFFSDSQKFIAECKSQSLEFSLMMFDIDHFKSINDTFGHACGDEALKMFCKIVKARIRESDIFARLGGEEFSLLMVGSKEQALQMAERLRKDVGSIEIETSKGTLTLTTSVGLSHMNAESSIDELMHQADAALYMAKNNGRNQVVEA